ncbi:hypothetical protein ILUMI_19089, partial [Ignelater luminosus]
SSDRAESKRMKTLQLRENYLADELFYAAQMSLRSDGRVEASKLVKDITTASPKRAERCMEDRQLKQQNPEMFTRQLLSMYNAMIAIFRISRDTYRNAAGAQVQILYSSNNV